jgi:hypothetical protein
MNLSAADLDRHQRLGIPDDLLARARVYRATDAEARDLLSINGKPGNFAGVVYPYLDPQSGRPITLRIRLDAPPLKPDGFPDKKYRQPFGDSRRLFFAPGAAALFHDVTVQVVIVESEKATLAITAAAERAGRRVLPIGLGGCYNWLGRIGKGNNADGERVDVKGPLADFDKLAWPARDTVILFDARPNSSVESSRQSLARDRRQRGADLRHGRLLDDDQRVNGPDDLIAVCGDTALWDVMDAARPETFARNDKGRIVANSLDNIRLALARLGTELKYDAFAREVLVNGESLEDSILDAIWVRIDDSFHFRPSKETLRTLLVTEAQRTAFHPVRVYLDGLQWDGQPRLDRWLTTYGGARASRYVAAVGALPLIAAVRRVRRPGCKFDELLILESPQGTLKSSALRALCPQEAWFSDDLPLGVDSKVTIERTAGKWIIEAAELHGQRGREVEQLKTFLSRQADGPVRLAYGRLPTTIPRQFVLIGSTNARLAYLKDTTGGRRFWPVTVRKFWWMRSHATAINCGLKRPPVKRRAPRFVCRPDSGRRPPSSKRRGGPWIPGNRSSSRS